MIIIKYLFASSLVAIYFTEYFDWIEFKLEYYLILSF